MKTPLRTFYGKNNKLFANGQTVKQNPLDFYSKGNREDVQLKILFLRIQAKLSDAHGLKFVLILKEEKKSESRPRMTESKKIDKSI